MVGDLLADILSAVLDWQSVKETFGYLFSRRCRVEAHSRWRSEWPDKSDTVIREIVGRVLILLLTLGFLVLVLYLVLRHR